MPEELGSMRERARAPVRVVQGLELFDLELDSRAVIGAEAIRAGPPPTHRALAVVSGIGKVAAARAATLLIEHGARDALLVVGTCGGLTRELLPGTLIHAARAIQVDFAVRAGREFDSDPVWRSAWMRVAPGKEGRFLTADQPVVSFWRRRKLARAYAGACVADMETAAVAWVASAAGVPWAALRAVTDACDARTRATFAHHYPTQAGRAADTVPALLSSIRSSS
jgi:adenosylhomocysteine nucleosidase